MLDTTPRRKDRTLSANDSWALLDAAEYGVLSLTSPDGSPYGVPLNFVRDGGTLILHGALEGRKIDSLRHDPHVSFCVVGDHEVLRERFSTRYSSVIVSGHGVLLDDDTAKLDALRKLCERFAPENGPNPRDAAERFAAAHLARTAIILVHIDIISGKAYR